MGKYRAVLFFKNKVSNVFKLYEWKLESESEN